VAFSSCCPGVTGFTILSPSTAAVAAAVTVAVGDALLAWVAMHADG